MFDDFETKVQVEEIIPEEYEDWLEELERAKEEGMKYYPTWAPGGCDWDETVHKSSMDGVEEDQEWLWDGDEDECVEVIE